MKLTGSGWKTTKTALKPLRSITWGRVPALVGRDQMVKLANSVYTHVFVPTEQIDWTTAGTQWGANEIPVFDPGGEGIKWCGYISKRDLTFQGDGKANI